MPLSECLHDWYYELCKDKFVMEGKYRYIIKEEFNIKVQHTESLYF